MEAQVAAHNGSMRPMEIAFAKLQEAIAAPSDSAHAAERCYPLSSPAAAEKLYAFQSDDGMDPGYQRAARQAYALDTTSVEALSTIGDFENSSVKKLTWYQLASEAAKKKPRDLVAAEMPRMRLHMGLNLIQAGYLTEAVDIMQEGFVESPNDEIGLRFVMADVLLRLQRHDELLDLVSMYDDPPGGILTLAGVIATFQRDGTSPELEQRLQESHAAFPKTARYLAGLDNMPHSGDRLNEFEMHAAHVAEHLLPGVHSKAGTARWIRETLQLLAVDDAEDGHADEASEQGLPEFSPRYGSLDDALELPDGKDTWKFIIEKLRDDLFMAALVDEVSVVALTRFSSQPNSKTLRAFILESICDPDSGQPRKPATLCLPTKALVKTLEKTVGTYGVACRQEKLSAEERQMIRLTFSKLAAQVIDRAVISECSGTTQDRRHDDGAIAEAEAAVADSRWNDLPRTTETWVIGVFRPPLWVQDGPTPYCLYQLLIVDQTSGLIAGQRSWRSKPSSSATHSAIAEVCHSPLTGRPRLPGKIFVDPESTELLQAAELNGIPILPGGEAVKHQFDELIRDLIRGSTSFSNALEEQPGVSADFLEGLFNNLADFYAATPWHVTAIDHLIELRDQASGQSWGVTIFGQLGITSGLSMVENIQAAKRFRQTGGNDDDACVTTIQFVEEFDMSALDHWSVQRHGWKIVDEEGFPLIAKMDVGAETPVCPDHAELSRINALLPALVHFVDQPRDSTYDFTDDNGRRYHLEWVID